MEPSTRSLAMDRGDTERGTQHICRSVAVTGQGVDGQTPGRVSGTP